MPRGRGGHQQAPLAGRQQGLLAVLATAASAQEHTFSDSFGKREWRADCEAAGVGRYECEWRSASEDHYHAKEQNEFVRAVQEFLDEAST